MKTTSIRLDDTTHAQLAVLAQLKETSITEIIQSAINSYIDGMRENPDLVNQAESVLADIDREAANRREAISTLFSNNADVPAPAKATRTRRDPSREKD